MHACTHVYTVKTTQQFRWVDKSFIVISTCAAHVPTHSNGCGGLLEKVRFPNMLKPVLDIHLLVTLSFQDFNVIVS